MKLEKDGIDFGEQDLFEIQVLHKFYVLHLLTDIRFTK